MNFFTLLYQSQNNRLNFSNFLNFLTPSKRFFLFDIFRGELAHFGGVFLAVVAEGASVCAALCHVERFRLWLGVVDGLCHGCGHEIVVGAMNHKHGQMAFLHLVEGRCLLEIPTIFPFTQRACHIQQRERRQTKHILQFVGKFVVHAGVAAISIHFITSRRSSQPILMWSPSLLP